MYESVLQEATELFRKLHFNAHRGDLIRGQECTIFVAPHWNEDNKTIAVIITCDAFGQRVNWAEAEVSIQTCNAQTSARSFLNHCGQAVFPSLPPGDYRISLTRKTSTHDLILINATSSASANLDQRENVFEDTGLVLSSTSSALAAESQSKSQMSEAAQNQKYCSSDGKILIFVRQKNEDVQIVFETNSAELAGAEVSVCLVDSENAIQANEKLILARVGPSCWECVWERAIRLTQECKLKFKCNLKVH